MNFTMFMPQVSEEDAFDTWGNQVDDINSVFEYIDEVVLGHIDTSPDDEDDDSGQNFLTIKMIDLFCEAHQFSVTLLQLSSAGKKFSPSFFNDVPLRPFDVLSPPPKA